MNYIFVADIHSNYEALKNLVAKTEEKVSTPYHFVFVGDYIDGYNIGKGTPIEVIRFIMDLVESGQATALLGNHDEYLVETSKGNDLYYKCWLSNGGLDTLESIDVPALGVNEVAHILNQRYKKEINFLRSLPTHFETKHIRAIHAGIDWRVPLEENSVDTKLWIREEFYNPSTGDILNAHKSNLNKTYIVGHTPTKAIKESYNNEIICLENICSTPIYLIDGGAKSQESNGSINCLILNEQGQFVGDFKLP